MSIGRILYWNFCILAVLDVYFSPSIPTFQQTSLVAHTRISDTREHFRTLTRSRLSSHPQVIVHTLSHTCFEDQSVFFVLLLTVSYFTNYAHTTPLCMGVYAVTNHTHTRACFPFSPPLRASCCQLPFGSRPLLGGQGSTVYGLSNSLKHYLRKTTTRFPLHLPCPPCTASNHVSTSSENTNARARLIRCLHVLISTMIWVGGRWRTNGVALVGRHTLSG